MCFATLRNLSLIALGFGLASPAFADLDAALATADLSMGERVFKKCAACHTVELGGKKKAGPNIYGTVGGPVAAGEGFKYSKALIEYGGEWTLERLDAFLTKPKAEVKGTKMTFAGLRKESDRANLIAYLNTFSDNPIEFGATEASAAAVKEEEYEFGILFDAPGVETTYYACTACHSEMIVAQQGLTREHWDELFEHMVEEHGMSEIEEPDRTEILDYLDAHYNEDRPNFPRPLGN
ncbi:cytochrome c family protein [uncultured Litoreibacter sp.]|uniref:c-type cytochrome n=1 Tax=uncultured Litoreibacter sp. TaxID=1392394 RepID=UPI00262278ED|nr:cytochrome c family protein [uncultured Litoreibacter sp.]